MSDEAKSAEGNVEQGADGQRCWPGPPCGGGMVNLMIDHGHVDGVQIVDNSQGVLIVDNSGVDEVQIVDGVDPVHVVGGSHWSPYNMARGGKPDDEDGEEKKEE